MAISETTILSVCVCTFCGTLGPVTSRGPFALCTTCIAGMQTTPCPPFAHIWRGAYLKGEDFWSCERCGTSLLPEAPASLTMATKE